MSIPKPPALSVILAALLFFVTPVYGQKIPLLQETLTGGGEQQDQRSPKPTDLVVGWWHYFEVEQESELKKRIATVKDDIEALNKDLPGDIAESSRPFIRLIRANLDTLPEVRAQDSAKLPAPPAYADNYTLSDFLALAGQLRRLRLNLDSETVDFNAADKALKTATKLNETQFASYLTLDTSNPQRTSQGLEIMARRLSILVDEERQRVRKSIINALTTSVAQFENELLVAEQRLMAKPDDLGGLSQSIGAAQGDLIEKQDELIGAKAAASSVVGSHEEELYHQQLVVKAEVEEALAKIRLFTLQAQRHIVLLLMDRNAQNSNPVRTQLASWKAELETIEQQVTDWISHSERERQRASRAATSGVSTEPLGSDAVPEALIRQYRQYSMEASHETLLAIERLQDQLDQTRLVLGLLDKQVLRKEGLIKDLLARGKQLLKQITEYASDWISVSLFTVGDTPVNAIGLLRIALILTIAWWISHWLRRALGQLGQRGDGSNLPAFYTIGRLSHYLIVILGFLIGLSSIGMDFTNFALVAGALAIGIGFGLQEIVNNFISGLILLFERSLKVGDFVQLGSGVKGEVKAINVRSTQIKTNENIDIVVPNSEFMNTNVINWTLQEPYMRVHYPFRVAFGMEKEVVRKAGLEAAEKVTHTLSGIPGKNPQVWLTGFGENGYDFELVVWLTPSAVKRPSAVRATYYWELETALRKYGVEVPIPQRDLYLRGGFETLRDEAPAERPARLEQPVSLHPTTSAGAG